MLLDQILFYVPCSIFWKSLDGVFLGCNKLFLEISGFNDYHQLVGKKDAELPWKKYSSEYYNDDQYVITNKKIITRIENIPLNGKIIISETTKAPLIQDGIVTGVLGICVDITDRIEKERLQLENQAHLTMLEQQNKFRTIVDQVAHDIRSPVASLNIIINMCDGVKKQDRILMQQALTRINDIANNLLAYFKLPTGTDLTVNDKVAELLVAPDLLEIINEKRYEYAHKSIEFITNFDSNSICINSNSQMFKRSISNLINNAVDAMPKTDGKVTIHLSGSDDEVNIIIEDNGVGMPDSIINNIMNNIAVTSGKSNGHGIGLQQVRDMLALSNGNLIIKSISGVGTKIILSFPKSC